MGSCRAVSEHLACARRDRYPDPDYHQLRQNLGRFHGVDPQRIVPGSGASELIHRLVGLHPGIVLAMRRTFVEYARAARSWNRDSLLADSEAEYLRWLPEAGLAFLCHPNNPDGSLQSDAFLESATRIATSGGTPLVLDLAYWSIRHQPTSVFPDGATLLFAPNKPLDCAGVRAAYLVAPTAEAGTLWREHAPSWVVGSEGVELLEAWCDPRVRAWLAAKSRQVERLLACLRSILVDAGWSILPTQANFLLASPPGESAVEVLRSRGLRIRDATNMGFPGWYRLAARPVRELALLRDALHAQV